MADTCPESTGERIRSELERMIDTVWSGSERALEALGLTGKQWMPRLDVIETDSQIQVIADVPGIDAQSIDISLTGNMLTISGTRGPREKHDGETVHCGERPSGPFSRSVALPVTVSAETVSAMANEGVLTITLEKPEESQPRKIQIEVR